MSPDRKSRFLRAIAFLTLVTFSFQQVSSAQTLQNDLPATSVSYEKSAQEAIESRRLSPGTLLPGEGQHLSSFDFLQQERSLWKEEPEVLSLGLNADEPKLETISENMIDQRTERSTFDEAIAELRPEYASAVILESLSEENVKQLLDLEFEVAVVILAGEIVLLTSGNEDEILTSKPAARILEASAFTAHTHPETSHIQGPSPLDLKNASSREYVLTDQSVYAYDLFDVEELNIAQFLSEFEIVLSRERARYKQNSVMARQQLNRFIKEMDLLNELKADAVVFRASEPPLVNPPVPVRVYSAARMSGNFVSIIVNNQSALSSVGRGFNLAVIDEATGQVLETRTFDTFLNQAQSDAMAAYIEGLPQGRYVAVVVHDEGSYSLNQRAKDALKTLGALDVQNLGWQQSYSLLGQKGLQPGEGMEKREAGNWMALVDAVPYVPSFPENYNVTFQAEHMGGISGWISWSDRWLNTNGMIYKQWQVPQPGGFDLEVVAKGTSEGNVWPLMEVRLNGQVIAGPVSVNQGGYTSYHFTGIPVSAGLHELQIVYTNDQGNRNLAVDRVVVKKSAGSVVQPPSAPTVQALPAFTKQDTLTLTGSKQAGTSIWINGVERVPASASTSWSYNHALAAGDGIKSFSVLAKDAAGTSSGAVNASTTLDQTLPAGTVSLQAGSAYALSGTVTATLTAGDALAGLDQVRYQVNGTWSAWESFAASKALTLTGGDGTKTVLYEIRDKAGNVWQTSDTIVLDTTAPSLTLTVNGGNTHTNTLSVATSLTASDAGSGLHQMRYQISDGAWSSWENYASSKQITLPSSDGSKEIRFEVKDNAGNVKDAVSSITLDTVAPVLATDSMYFQAQTAENGLGGYWSFDDVAGTSAEDGSENNNHGILVNGPVTSADYPPLTSNNDGSLQFDGVNDYVTTSTEMSAPHEFTISLWFKATGAGGRLIGFGSNQTGDSTAKDRHVFMGNWGHLYFSVYSGGIQMIQTPQGYNDGQWHHLTASMTSAGMALYVDGQLKAQKTNITSAGNYQGYWRLGGDNLYGWWNYPSNYYFKGNMDEARVYNRQLSLQEIQTLAQGGVLGSAVPPSAIQSNSLTVSYKLGGLSKSKTFSGLQQGENQLRISETDEAGNNTTLIGRVTVNLPNQSVLPDGTQLFRSAGILQKEITPWGDEIFYRADGSVEKYRYADGREIHYIQGNSHPILFYNAQGVLEETLDTPAAPQARGDNWVRVGLTGGLSAFYEGQALMEILTETGIRITNVSFDASGSMKDAFLFYPDGTMDILRGSKRIRHIGADHSLLDFLPSGGAVREIFSDHTDFYHFSKASQAEILKTFVKSSTGSETTYDDQGLLSEVRKGESVLYYDRQLDGEAFRLFLNKELSSEPDAKTMIEGSFDSEGVPLWIALKDGTRIYYQNGRLDRVVDSLGVTIDYDFETSDGFVKELTVSRGGASFQYAADGFLEKIVTASGSVTRTASDTNGDGKLTDEQIVDILLDEVGGNTLTDFELDSEGNILNGIIQTREGIKQRIQNGILTGYETVDGKFYEITEGVGGVRQASLKEWKFRDGTRAIYGGSSITEILYPDGRRLHTLGFGSSRSLESYVEELADGTRKYFEDGKLKKMTTPAGAVIDFGSEGMAEKITFLDGEEQTLHYVKDSSGALSEIAFRGNYSQRSFDPQGHLRSVVTAGVRAEIDDGALQRIYTRYGSVDNPEFSSGGFLSGELSFVDGTLQTVSNGELQSLLLASGSKVFYENARVSRFETSEGVYSFHYNELMDVLAGMSVSFDGAAGSWSRPLIPYLLENVESEISLFLLSRPLYNSLGQRRDVQSEFETGDSLYFAKLTPDLFYGDVYGIGMDYLPYWNGLDSVTGSYNGGYITSNLAIQTWSDIPSQMSDLTDINGDGLLDRVMMNNSDTDFWWVQLNTGQGFLPSVRWSGVDPTFNLGALKYYTVSPYVLGTLMDVNGDKLPDRVMQKPDGSPDWWIQLNHGTGFDPVRKWEGNVQPLQQPAPEAKHAGQVWDWQGNKTADLIDVDGDGLPDRVVRPLVEPLDHWFWQKNLGNGFADAVLWDGVALSFHSDLKTAAALNVYVQVQNNFETPAAAAIRQKVAEWDQSIAYAEQACDNVHIREASACRMNANSLVMTAVGNIKQVISQYGATAYAWYMNDPGVDYYSIEDYDRFKNAALYIINLFQSGYADVIDFTDLNGDGLPDRILLKPKAGQSSTGQQEWWWQKNNGDGFESPTLWDSDVRALPSAPTEQAGTSIRYMPSWLLYRDSLIDLQDVTGDGLPDRVTMDQHGPVHSRHESWWVEVNTGAGFAAAVEWTGIYGASGAQSAIAQDMERFRNVNWGAFGAGIRQQVDLADISGDGILDRLIYEPDAAHWKVQLGTGSGFLPVQEMEVESLIAPAAQVNTSRYDYLHVTLKAEADISTELGVIKVMLGDPADPDSYQEWSVQNVSTVWKDFYLPLNKSKDNAEQVRIVFEPSGENPPTPVYIDNMTFAAIRPSATKDWLERLLAEENVLSEVYSDRNETLAGYLGYLESGTENETLSLGLFESLMNAETRIEFNHEGNLKEFETLYGAVSKVEDGRITETLLPNGHKVEFSEPVEGSTQTSSRTVTDSSGQSMIQELSYGRVRQVNRTGKPPLQYSYEFDSLGREITVIFDPDTGVTERYQDIAGQSRIISRTEANSIVTVFNHDSAGERTSAEVMYKGRVYETYLYGKTVEGLVTVAADSGVVEEYDVEGKIRYHTTADGYRYAHSFEKARSVEVSYETEIETLPDQTVINVQIPVVSLRDCETNCEDVHRVSLTGFSAEDGTEASYQDGNLTSLKYPDGTRIFFTRTVVNERTDPETGEILPELLLMDALVIHPDGTSTEYRDGKPYAVKKAQGHVVSLETEQGLLINSNESAVFHYAQALKLWSDFVKPQWSEFVAPGSLALEIDYDAEGQVVTRRYAEGVTEVYENGRILMTVGAQGERLTRYDYDAEGNPVRIELEASRRRLASAVLELRTEVALERQKALAKLAEREQVLNQTIEGEYIVQRDRLLAIKSRIESQREKIASLKVKGKVAKAAIGDASQQIQAGLDQVNAALEKLAQNRIDALEQLASQVEDTSDEIETKTEASYEEITSQETLMRQAILRHEVSPVIYHWYRKILGRDPAKAEYDLWISRTDYVQGVFNLEQLKTDLLQSPELAARTSEVNFIKAEVTDGLRHYLSLTQEQRLGFASALGIAAGKLVSLSTADGESVLTWLNSRSLHFGQSAYVALESMLAKAGLTYERRELARRLILVDILTGTLTPLESEDLLISMFALKTVAAFYGLSGEGYAMNYQSLKALYDAECPSGEETCQFRAIAHIDGNHYIVVTKITEEEVTFIETGSASPEHLDIHTMSKEEFLASWIDASNPTNQFGYIFSAQPPPEAEFSAQRVTIMDDSKLMRVRGAFFIELIVIAVIAVAKAVIAAVAATIAAISAIISGIAAGIGSILSGFGSLFSGLFTGQFLTGLQGLFHGVVTGIGQIAGAVFQGVVAFGHTFAEAYGVSGMILKGVELSATSFLKSFAATSFVKGTLVGSGIGLGFQGVGKLLEVMGVSPKISQTLMAGGKIITGAVMLGAGNVAGLGLLSGGSSEFLSLHTNLSPAMSGIIGIGAAALGAFAGGVGSLSGLEALKSVVPHLSMDLASSGLTALGNALNLDPRITALASLPLRASIGNGLGNILDVKGYENLLANIKRDVIGDFVSIGSLVALDVLNVPVSVSQYVGQFLGAIAYGQMSSGEQYSNSAAKVIDQLGSAILPKLTEGISRFGNVIKNYAGQALSFGSKVLQQTGQFTEQAFKNTLSSFSSLFGQKTQEYLYQDLAGLRQGQVNFEGDNWVWRAGSESVSYNPATGQINNVSGLVGSIQITGLGETVSGEYQYEKLSYESVLGDGLTRVQTYEKGILGDISVYYEDINILSVLSDQPGGITANTEGAILLGDVRTYHPYEINLPPDFPNPDPNYVKPYIPAYVRFETQNGWLVDAEVEIQKKQIPSRPQKELFVLTNGILSPKHHDAPSYLENFRKDIINESGETVASQDVILAHTFHKLTFLNFLKDAGYVNAVQSALNGMFGTLTSFLGGAAAGALADFAVSIMKDLTQWALEVADPQAHAALSMDIKSALEFYLQRAADQERNRNIVAVGYSGGFLPLVEVLNNAPKREGINSGYNTKSVVAIGAATIGLQDILLKVIEAGDKIRTGQASIDFLKSLTLDFFGGAFQMGDFIREKIAQFLANQSNEDAYQEYKRFVDALDLPVETFAQSSLLGTAAEMVVNIYGTKDVLGDLKFNGVAVGGFRSEMLGYSISDSIRSLFNVEILNAGHNDYIRNDIDDYNFGGGAGIGAGLVQYNDLWGRHAWNDIVSTFVAQLVNASKSKSEFLSFLESQIAIGRVVKYPDKWVVSL